MEIKVRYVSVDGYSKSAKFKTLAGARRFACKWVGAAETVGQHRAFSEDGVGKIIVSGDASVQEVLGLEPEKPMTPAWKLAGYASEAEARRDYSHL